MSAEQELFQACSEQGELTVPGLSRQEIRSGALHASSHVWIVRQGAEGSEILLQLRAYDKATWPGFWDISAAGHVDFGETPLDAAKRESKEEIGVELVGVRLRLLCVRRDLIAFHEFVENEFRWIYLYEWQQEQAELLDGEVEELEWVSFARFFEMIQNPDESKLVNQGKGYFETLAGYLAAYENH